jgi:arsenate reductase
MTVVVYHNPRCSKSRDALKIVEGRGIRPEVVEYLKTPPSVQELKAILAKLGMRPRDLMRRKEAAYKELGLDDPALSDDALVAAMVANPLLIERPIVVNGDRAALGRPPEAVLAVL